MSKYQAGHEVLLKARFSGSDTFQTIAGIQTRTIRFPDTSVDVTNQESEGNWREKVQGIGTESLDFDGDGVFVSNAVSVQLIQARQARQLLDCQVVVPGLGTFEGPFAIGSLEFTGTQSTELKFRASFMSAGAIGFTPSA